MERISTKNKRIIGKAYARANWATVVKEVSEGKIFYVTDRQKFPEVVISSVENWEKELGNKKMLRVEGYAVYGVFAGRDEMRDSVKWVRERRSKRRLTSNV